MSDDPGDRRCSDSSLHARNVPNDSGAVFSSRFDVRVGGALSGLKLACSDTPMTADEHKRPTRFVTCDPQTAIRRVDDHLTFVPLFGAIWQVWATIDTCRCIDVRIIRHAKVRCHRWRIHARASRLLVRVLSVLSMDGC